MGRCYHYAAGTRAALEAKAAELGLAVRVTETKEIVEVLVNDDPKVKSWEANQVASAIFVTGVPDGAASQLTTAVASTDLSAITAAKTDAEYLAAAKALATKLAPAGAAK